MMTLPTLSPTRDAPTLAAGRSRLPPRLAAGLLAAAAAASLVYWALQIADSRRAASVATVPANAARLPEVAEPERIARLLAATSARTGASAAAPAGSPLQLTGVAAGTSGRGAALISVDGRPARPFAVGMAVGEGLVLQSVQGRRALLGPALQGPSTVTLELPPLPR
jgi:general secretion pathway protein C